MGQPHGLPHGLPWRFPRMSILPFPIRHHIAASPPRGENTSHFLARRFCMSGVRVLVGTRKGAFVLTSDEKRQKWDVSAPHFAGWEMYHLKGSPADPNRIYASQSSGWFGQQIQRSDDGGKTWSPVGNKFA